MQDVNGRDAFRRRHAAWKESVLAEALRRAPAAADRRTPSGLPIEPVYTSADLPADLDEELPGQFPFTRGVDALGYRASPWIVGQYAGFGSPAETNGRFKASLAQGQTGLAIALDLPTQVGYDPDHPSAAGEVGKVGVPIASLRDMEEIFDGILLSQPRQISTTANAIAPIMAAMFLALAEQQGIAPTSFSVRFQNDILKEYVARGTYIFPPAPSVRFATDLTEYVARYLPSWVPMSISGYHVRDSGVDVVTELAFTFSSAICYLQAALERGLDVDVLAPQLRLFFSAHRQLFEEVAKFRAARRVWARLLSERFGATRPESLALKIIAYTAGSTLTAQQPLNNVVRVTLESLAAILGGVQVLFTSSWDEAISLPSESAARLALRTQQILLHESGVADAVDPLGGSYFVETLTHELEGRVWAILAQVDELGGPVAAIEKGFFAMQINDAAYRSQRDLESGAQVVVGVNRYAEQEPATAVSRFVAPASEEAYVRTFRARRDARDQRTVEASLRAVRHAAAGAGSTIPALLQAVRAYATIGEICDTLRAEWGTAPSMTLV